MGILGKLFGRGRETSNSKEAEAKRTVKNLKQEASDRAANYKRALTYLEGCGSLTLDKLRQMHRIAGMEITESELETMWRQAQYILPGPGRPGGHEALRFVMRDVLYKGIKTFGDLSKVLDNASRKL